MNLPSTIDAIGDTPLVDLTLDNMVTGLAIVCGIVGHRMAARADKGRLRCNRDV